MSENRLQCPKCQGTSYRVMDTRHEREVVLRHRVCLGCGNTFFTYETTRSPDEIGRAAVVKYQKSSRAIRVVSK